MRSNHQIKTTAAVLLALAATAPAAAANATGANPVVRPNPDQQTIASQPKPAKLRPTLSRAVQPNPDQQTTIASTGPHSEVIDNGGYGPANPASTIVRVRAPSRQPSPDQQITTASTGPHSEVIDNGGYGSANPAPTIVRVLAPSRGFDWGAAGIGAAGALGLSFLALGGALLIYQRRGRRTRASAATTN